MTAAGITAIAGAGLSMRQAYNEEKLHGKMEQWDQWTIQQDAIIVGLEANQQRSNIRRQAADEEGALIASSAASGVDATSGSASEALIFHAQQRARDEYNVYLEETVAKARLKQESRMAKFRKEIGVTNARAAAVSAAIGGTAAGVQMGQDMGRAK